MNEKDLQELKLTLEGDTRVLAQKCRELIAELETAWAEEAKLHRYLDLMEVADYYDDFECVHEFTVTPHYSGTGEYALCDLCGASCELNDPVYLATLETEEPPVPECNAGKPPDFGHKWRVSPYDAGMTFCCLCGLEHE